MKRKSHCSVLSFFLVLLVMLVGFSHVSPAHASVDYNQGNNVFHLSFSSSDDLGDCQTNSYYWLVNLGYADGTEVQGGYHSTDFTQSTDDTFDIPDGTKIQKIEIWIGDSQDSVVAGQCKVTVASDSNGVFIWNNAPPVISNILVSDVTSSSVTISWDTDKTSDGTIDYGPTNSYGSTASDSNSSTTSHSVSISGLSANTTYHYNVKSTGSGGSSESGDNTYVTATDGTTGTTQTGTSKSSSTTGTVVAATPTPTPIADLTPPTTSITTNFSKSFKTSPQITGRAYDGSGISRLEYSLDDGRNWSEVDKFSLGSKSVAFTFTPPPLEDDNYKIRIRATDDALAKNVSVSEAYTMVIDRLPPRISGTLLSIGPQVLAANNSGYILTSKGVTQKLTLSTVGGPINITLFAYHPGATESATSYTLSRNPDNGLWSTDISFDGDGIYQLEVKAIDGAQNETTQLLNKVAILKPGKVTTIDGKPIKNAQITLYYFEDKYQEWRVWDGLSFNQKNPVTTNTDGEFYYFVPPGKYYFDIQAYGYYRNITNIFTLTDQTVLNPTFSLKELKVLLDLWLYKIYVPDFSIFMVPVTQQVPSLPPVTYSLINNEAPEIALHTSDNGNFDLFSTRGSPVVMTFLNLWSPQTREQVTALDQLNSSGYKAYALVVGDKASKANLLKQSEQFHTPFIVDPDASVVSPYNLSSLPTHYFINRRGIVKKVVSGILNAQELENILLEIE